MARTNPSEVQGILGRDYDSERAPSLAGRIATASIKTNQLVVYAGAGVFGDEELFWIETWLAAHYYAVSDRPLNSKSTLDASGSFDGQTGMALDATLYGQTANELSGGYLAAMADANYGTVDWGGLAPSEQTAIEDRD